MLRSVLYHFTCYHCTVVYKKDEGKERPVAADEHYDVFVSVDEKDDVALTWVIQVLLPLLEKRDLPLSVYLPARQELPGECKAEVRKTFFQANMFGKK